MCAVKWKKKKLSDGILQLDIETIGSQVTSWRLLSDPALLRSANSGTSCATPCRETGLAVNAEMLSIFADSLQFYLVPPLLAFLASHSPFAAFNVQVGSFG